MSQMDRCPNVEDCYEETYLPDELATLRKDLQTLSGDALCMWLKRWKELLMGDTKQTSLMLTIFSEVSHKVNGRNPIKDNLLFLDFLAELKQAFFSCDIFVYGETLYDEYLECIYRTAGSYSYYLKPEILQKYVQDELEQYKQVRMILEEHYTGTIIEWFAVDAEKRIAYFPSKEEVDYLTEHAETLIKEEGNIDKALFFLYRAALLSLKRFLFSKESEMMQEKQRLLEVLFDMAFAYQIASDEKHAFDVLEYAKKLIEQKPIDPKQAEPDSDTQTTLAQNTDLYKWNQEESPSESYQELIWKILRKKAQVQEELLTKKKGVTKEEVFSSYQEALHFSESVFGKESMQAEEDRKDMAWFRANSGEQKEVIVLLEQLKKAEEEEDFDTMESLHGIISEVYEEAGDFENAILHYQRKLNLIIDEYGADSDMAADYYNMFGELYERAGNYSKARSCYEHALENYRGYLLRTQEEDADDPETTLMNYEECLYHTGKMHFVIGEYEDAIAHFQESVAIFDSRAEYASGERADYLKALAETYEKMLFMGKACHYYLWAWDIYQTVAEFNRMRERNAALFESETEECIKKADEIQVHMKEIGMDAMFGPVEEIAYPALKKEEREYFLKRFGQIVRRRLKGEDIWKNWIFQWKVYHRIWMEWQQKTEEVSPPLLEKAFFILQRYLKKDVTEKEFMEFSTKFFSYLSDAGYADEEDFEDFDDWVEDSAEDSDEDLEADWEEDFENWEDFYFALADFFHAILEAETDYNSFQVLICERLPLWGEMFTSVYSKEEEYTEYEQTLRYQQVISSSVFARWIADIQKDIRLVLSSQTQDELWKI